jgi:hypothetical protein
LPNLLSFSTCCVNLELRPLPSTGITRLPRYYEPLRHPKAPGLSLTGIQLVIAPRHGASRVACVSLVYMLSPIPRCSNWDRHLLKFPQSYQLSPLRDTGQPAHCPFRGLLGVHSRYGLHTHTVTVYRDSFTKGFSQFVTSLTASVASGRSSSRVGLSPTGTTPPLHGAPPKPTVAYISQRIHCRPIRSLIASTYHITEGPVLNIQRTVSQSLFSANATTVEKGYKYFPDYVEPPAKIMAKRSKQVFEGKGGVR